MLYLVETILPQNNINFKVSLAVFAMSQETLYATCSRILHYAETLIFLFFLFLKLGFASCKTEQPLQGMELQEREAQED